MGRFYRNTEGFYLNGIWIVIALLGCLLTAPVLFAQEEKSTTEEILIIMKEEGRISEARYNELLERLEEEEVDGVELTPYWDNGLGLISDDGNFEIEIGGRIMVDWGYITADDPFEEEIEAAEEETLGGNGVEFRRARLFLEGTIYERVIFKAQYDFAGGDAEFKDVYMGMTDVPAVGTIMVGHFKEPFSIEEQTSSKYITFMERSLPVEAFSPGRNTGIKISNAVFDERMHWAVGAYYDADDFGDGFNDYSDYNITARLTGAPIYADDGNIAAHLGISYSHQFRDEGEEDAAVDYSARPEVHITDVRFVDTGDIVADDVDLYSGEAALVMGPFSVQGEYMQAMVSSDATGDPDLSGYYAFASFFLTGEHRDYDPASGDFGRVSPNVSVTEGGPGAWEIAARYSYLDLNDSGVAGGELSDITGGVNWYLNPSMRMMFNYVYADLEDRPGVVDDSAEAYQMRFQIDF